MYSLTYIVLAGDVQCVQYLMSQEKLQTRSLERRKRELREIGMGYVRREVEGSGGKWREVEGRRNKG